MLGKRCAFLVLVILGLVVSLCFPAAAAHPLCDQAKSKPLAEPATLRVALYPYVPDSARVFQQLEAAFECLYPGLNLELVEEPNATYRYYDFDMQKKRGFQFVDADIYEIDTILLSDFVAAKKIAPIALPYNDFDAAAVRAVERNGVTYAVPHWLCGNFLFYRRGDAEIANARTWTDLSTILAERGQTLFVDLKGGLTLGEWYLTVLTEVIGLEAAQQAIVQGAPVNEDAIGLLTKILDSCPAGFCRSETLHDRTGIYSRAFVRGQVAAYVGYSESIHYGLRETFDNCLPGSGCLNETQIAVRKLPSIGRTDSAGLGWVDALAIDARLTGAKKELALAFVRFATDIATYRLLLTPEWPYRSRYLLAARRIGEIKDAPLYDAFYAAHNDRQTGTAEKLSPMLREFAKKVVDCALPRDRDDRADCVK
jgi:thiamine pyridinylase